MYQQQLLAPAKINLFTELSQKRSDGYHEIETVMVPISIFDELRIVSRDDGILKLSIFNRLANHETNHIPADETNLVYRAIRQLQLASGTRKGANIELVKRIPVKAGLGGGSSDAASALLATNRLWGLDFEFDRLHDIASQLGSDVPFFLHGGAKLCLGRGEKLSPVGKMTRLWLVVAKPFFGFSTPEVYRYVTIPTDPKRSHDTLTAWKTGKIEKLGRSLFNQLQIAAQRLSPLVNKTNEYVRKLPGCVGTLLSGSGSSFFGIFRRYLDTLRAAKLLRGTRVFESVFCCHSM
jgi:4-diphosphocytidyl-2-C-methyl-D-erythritol kinase